MKKRLFAVGLLLIMVLSGCAPAASDTAEVVALSDVPEFSGEPYVVINDNEPSFPAEDFTSEGFEEYSSRPRSAAASATSSRPAGRVCSMTL